MAKISLGGILYVDLTTKLRWNWWYNVKSSLFFYLLKSQQKDILLSLGELFHWKNYIKQLAFILSLGWWSKLNLTMRFYSILCQAESFLENASDKMYRFYFDCIYVFDMDPTFLIKIWFVNHFSLVKLIYNVYT